MHFVRLLAVIWFPQNRSWHDESNRASYVDRSHWVPGGLAIHIFSKKFDKIDLLVVSILHPAIPGVQNQVRATR